MLIGELYDGTSSHQIVNSISSSGKTMLIDFKKIEGGWDDWNAPEFLASIKYNKINPECQSWIDNNILMSPNNPKINCSWIFTRKYGSYIALDFSFLEVKKEINVIVNNAIAWITFLEHSLRVDLIS